MENFKKSGRSVRKDKEKSKNNKFFGSKKHVRNVESRSLNVSTNSKRK